MTHFFPGVIIEQQLLKKDGIDLIYRKAAAVCAAMIIVILALLGGCGDKTAKDPNENTTEKTSLSSEDEDKQTEEKVSSGDAAKTGESQPAADTADAEPENFFDDAVFVGDSVTLGLRNYVSSERNEGNDCLGSARFLTAGSMGYSNAIMEIGEEDAIHPLYEGEEVYIEDGLSRMNAKKVFIMLGTNDFCIYSTETGMKNVETLINRIISKNPDIGIYIQSVTPTLYDRGSFNNENIDIFNEALQSLCSENGWNYVDVASVMKDESGSFIAQYCSDPEDQGIHMAYEGCEKWISYLTDLYGSGNLYG